MSSSEQSIHESSNSKENKNKLQDFNNEKLKNKKLLDD